MPYYKEINSAGTVTGYQQTAGTPKSTDSYTYTEATEDEYKSWLTAIQAEVTTPMVVAEAERLSMLLDQEYRITLLELGVTI